MINIPSLSIKKIGFHVLATSALFGAVAMSLPSSSLFPPEASAQVSRAAAVPIVKIDFVGGFLVQEDVNRGLWAEFDSSGTRRYGFETLSYAEPRLRLRGRTGNVQLLVNTQNKTVSGEWPGQPMTPLYDITDIEFSTNRAPAAIAAPRVETGLETVRPVYTPPGKERSQNNQRLTPQTLSVAEYENGKFFRVAGQEWLENASDGRIYRYEKIGSDKDSVFLYDASRQYLLALNVKDKMSRVSEKGQMMQGLYPLTKLSSRNSGNGSSNGNVTPMPDQEGKMNALERTQCLTKGGFIERAGMLGYERCTMRYSDGGNICIDSSNCDGKCLATPQDSQSQAVSGLCQKTDSPFGCYAEVIAGKVGPALCVE